MKVEVWRSKEFERDVFILRVNGWTVLGPTSAPNARRIVLWDNVNPGIFTDKIIKASNGMPT